MILDPTLLELVEKIKIKSLKNNCTISVAESCTGGLVAGYLTAIDGASNYFDTGVISYSNEAKINILKVPEHILDRFGAVSEETAQSMAAGLSRIIFNKKNIILSITGIAGPTGGSKQKPIGTTCFGVYANKILSSKTYCFSGNRQTIRLLACKQALLLILENL